MTFSMRSSTTNYIYEKNYPESTEVITKKQVVIALLINSIAIAIFIYIGIPEAIPPTLLILMTICFPIQVDKILPYHFHHLILLNHMNYSSK